MAGSYMYGESDRMQSGGQLSLVDLDWTARGVAFEDLPALRASLEDLDLEALSEMRGKRTGLAELIALGLALREGSGAIPTNAGILVACPHPDRYLPSAWVHCGRIGGVNRTDIFDQTEVHTFLPRAVEHVMAFLAKHAAQAAESGAPGQQGLRNLPLEPIREVVVNALVHASYAERGTPIRVTFLDDRIEVESPGGLVAGMTIANMPRVSRLRNPVVARIFREMGIMEQWGTGVRRVFEEMAREGLPTPQIEEIVDRLRFSIFIAHQRTVADPTGSPATRRAAPETAGQHLDLDHETDSPGRHARRILAAAVAAPASREVLLGAVGVSNDTRNVRRLILPLIESGLLARILPGTPTSPRQRYQTTNAGKALLLNSDTATLHDL